ncbi:MAG: hypothetical protein MUO40_00150 [Anaerolineaceae bacterium]|nr:hypothetical protein [Anaerolineaceae bacterium]
MTRRSKLTWLAIFLALLLVGYLYFMITKGPGDTPESAPFRIWFWENRSIDIYVQVGLLFAGALGVAIIFSSQNGDQP